MRKIINREKLIQQYNSGITLKEMGRLYVVSAPTITHYAIKLGLALRGRGNRKVMFFENKKEL